MIEELKVGDKVEVTDYSKDWDGKLGIIKEIKVTWITIEPFQDYPDVQCKKGELVVVFGNKNLKFVSATTMQSSSEVTSKLKLKASGLRVTILELKGDQVRFKLENGSESDWVPRSQLDRDCVQV